MEMDSNDDISMNDVEDRGTGNTDECRDFKKGNCRRGARCKYAHPKLEVCRDYQTKGCTRPKCKFVHVSRDEEQLYENTGQIGQLPTNSPAVGGNSHIASSFGGGMQDLQGLLGKKRRSDTLDLMAELLLGGRPQNAPTEMSNNLCRDFERGDCSRGTRCKYYHPKLRICRDFQNDKCSRESCRFLHMSREEEASYENSGIIPDHIDEDKAKKNKVIDMPPQGGNTPDIASMLGKRRRDDVISMASSLSTAPQAVLQENELLKQKITELQQQIVNLHQMNDTLYQQNAAYRSKMRGGTLGI